MLCDILTFLYTDTSRVIFDTVDDRCLIISPNTSVDCTGEETALSQCSSSLSISEICQYLLVDCNPHTDIDPNIDPPNNEESTEETDTGNDDDDDKDSTEETGNEGNITTEDGTASADTKGSSATDIAGIITGVVVALFILVILTVVIVLTIFLLKRKTQETNKASSIKLQVNQLYDFPNTYGGDIEESFEEKSLVTNPAYGLARHPTFTQPQTDSLLATESNAHQPHTDNGPESPVLLANSTWHNGAASAAAPIYETI